MNPIALFYCFEEDQLIQVVAEVHNTPWNERYVYVVPISADMASRKQFHVSPFMPMNTEYHWQLSVARRLLPRPDTSQSGGTGFF